MNIRINEELFASILMRFQTSSPVDSVLTNLCFGIAQDEKMSKIVAKRFFQ